MVGVAADIKYEGLASPTLDTIYTPFAQTPFPWMYLIVRAAPAPETLAQAVREAVRAVDGRQPIGNLQPLTHFVDESVAQPRFHLLLVGVFGLVALALAIVGTYGLIAFVVAQRTREIGIRIALGASPRDVVAVVVRQAAILATAGTALGVVAALATTRLLASLLFGVSATDAVTYDATALVVLAVALGASWVPARRAAGVDPMISLREE